MKRDRIAYLCRNEKEFHFVLNYLHNKGYQWSDGDPLINNSDNVVYLEGANDMLCVSRRVSYARIGQQLHFPYKEIEAKSLMLSDRTKRTTLPKL